MRCGLRKRYRDLVKNHSKYAPMFHRSRSVGAQIHHELIDLGLISQYTHLFGPQICLQLYAFGQCDRHPLEGFLDGTLDVHRDIQIRRDATEREKLLRQRLGTRAGLEHFINAAARLTATRLPQRESAIAANRAEQIVEIMCDPGCTLIDDFNSVKTPLFVEFTRC